MRLTVDHQTTYRYDHPVRSAVQSHRLAPSVFEGQRTLDWEVTVTGGVPGGSFRDGAGDRVQAWTVAGPLQEITVSVRGSVETQDCAGVLRGHRESLAPETLARGVAGRDRLDMAHALAAAVAGAIAYRPGATHAHTTAAEALALAEGVCQDHAHALIACARVHGIPARYVSGYLLAAQDGTPHEAAHAWTELHVPGLGWVGFDPANRCCPDPRYIRLGSGFDARAAAPIRGIARGLSGGAPEGLDVRVAILAGAQ
jgi:transglutaminase-like putative cysteine protease